MNTQASDRLQKEPKGFSLIEVVLAMGIFLITILSIIGLLGPAFKSVAEVRKADEVASVVDSVNAFLQSSPYIATAGGTRFDAVYSAVEDDGYATIFVYRWYDSTNAITRLETGFEDNQNGNVNNNSVVNINRHPDIPAASYASTASAIYRVVLTASSVMLADGFVTEGAAGSYPRYTLNQAAGSFTGNYLALEGRIFVETGNGTPATTNMGTLATQQPVFTYNTAILE